MKTDGMSSNNSRKNCNPRFFIFGSINKSKKKVEGKTVYSIENGTLLICLEERVTAKALRGMMGLKPQQVICLDNAFGNNDQLKTNTVLEMRDHEIEFRTV